MQSEELLSEREEAVLEKIKQERSLREFGEG